MGEIEVPFSSVSWVNVRTRKIELRDPFSLWLYDALSSNCQQLKFGVADELLNPWVE